VLPAAVTEPLGAVWTVGTPDTLTVALAHHGS
jgi:hypothetical protein